MGFNLDVEGNFLARQVRQLEGWTVGLWETLYIRGKTFTQNGKKRDD